MAALQDVPRRRTAPQVPVMRKWLEHSSTRGLELDDPATTARRHEIIRGKKALRAIYSEWYRFLSRALPEGEGQVLELGSGGGFLGEIIPGVVRSDVFPYPWLDLALDAQALPFRKGALRGIVMTNVLHHLPAPPGSSTRRLAACAPPEWSR